MLKHFFIMSAAIAVGLALAKMFGGTGLTSILSGTTSSTTSSCHLAAAVFNEDFETGPRVRLVRRWLYQSWIHTGLFARVTLAVYSRYSRQLAAIARRYAFVRRACEPVFAHALKQARATFAA